MSDCLSQPWCCLDCREKFTFGQHIAANALHCPFCKGTNTMRADGQSVVATHWQGGSIPKEALQ
jgi:hypothetical protein